MKKLIALVLCILLLAGCAKTYDGPTKTVPRLTEYTADHYYAFFDWEEQHYTSRTVYAYDIYGNRVRYMEYRDDELRTVTNLKYDDRGNEISRTVWDHTGWIPKYKGRTEQTYDDQNRQTAYIHYNFWGRQDSASWYTYDDEARTRTWTNDNGDTQTTWFDENGNEIRQTDGEYEIIYHYDDRGNRIGWESYQNGQPFDRYEAHYDDLDRQIWGGRYDANGNLTSQTEYVYDDEQGIKTYHKNDGSRRVEYYDGDGRPHMIEDYSPEGELSMRQRYYYRDIQIPAEEE